MCPDLENISWRAPALLNTLTAHLNCKGSVKYLANLKHDLMKFQEIQPCLQILIIFGNGFWMSFGELLAV